MKGNSGILLIIGYVVFFVILYLIMMMPQRKADKKKKEMLNSATIGDEVVTISGIHGRIVGIKENQFLMQLADEKVKVTIEKWAIKEVTNKAVDKNAKKVEIKKKVEEKTEEIPEKTE